jgi:hypothetical protein
MTTKLAVDYIPSLLERTAGDQYDTDSLQWDRTFKMQSSLLGDLRRNLSFIDSKD